LELLELAVFFKQMDLFRLVFLFFLMLWCFLISWKLMECFSGFALDLGWIGMFWGRPSQSEFLPVIKEILSTNAYLSNPFPPKKNNRTPNIQN
jgi:hypothetical protein